MAKKEDRKQANYDHGITEENIGDACTDFMRIFGANNNIMRHMSDALDGLQLSQRRILWTMYEMNLKPKNNHTKVKNIVGRAMLYHPHGDAAIEDTLVNMAQGWRNMNTFVDGKGNFGSSAGDVAAGGRYIEARLSQYAYKCFFEEFSPEIVNMQENYLGTDLEPEYLPSKYPNALINNSFGIGYGIMTSIPTYNFKEVCLATIDLINNPNTEVFLIPDSATGAYIVDEGNFPEINKTGHGKFKMRGKIEVDESDNSLIVSSTPLMVGWNTVKPAIINLLNDGNNNIIKGISDITEDKTMRFKIHLKKEVDPVAAMHTIYEKTDMEKTFPVRFKLTESYTAQDYNVKSLLLTWIDFRRETKRRYYAHRLRSLRERQHILAILIRILNKDNAEKTVKIFKNSENTAECAKSLMKTYGITSLQAETIADMKFSKLTKEAYRKYLAEKDSVDDEIEKTDKIIRSPKKIDKIIIDELKDGIKMFGEDRRSEIVTIDNEVKVRATDHIIVFTRNGFVKKLPIDVKSIGSIAQGDFPLDIIEINNTSDLMLFDASGSAVRVPVSKIPNSTLNSNGFKLSDYCNISGSLVTAKVAPTNEYISNLKAPLYYLMVTRNGYIKKTLASAFVNMKKSELAAMIIGDNDSLVCCKMLSGDKDIIVYSDKGMGVRFNTANITETGRMSRGSMSMQLADNERIIGMDILGPKDKYLFILTDKGSAKKCTLETFGVQGRNGKSARIVTVGKDDNIKLIRTVRGDEKFRIFTKNEMLDISVKDDVVELPRLSAGRKLIGVKRGDGIINIKEL